MDRSVNSKTLYLRLLGHVRPYWRAVALSLLATLVMAATEPLFPALIRPLLDHGFSSNDGFSHPLLVPLCIVAIFFVRGLFNYFSSYGFSWVSNKVITDIRAQMYARLVHLPHSYFQKNASSIPLTKIAYDVNGVAYAATQVVVTVLRDGLTVIGLIAWIFWLNWKLTLLCLLLIPVIAFVMRTFSGRLRHASREAQVSTASMVEALQETAHCMRIIKVFGGEAQEMARFSRSNQDVRRQNMRQAVAAAATNPIMQFFASIAVAVVVYIALAQSASGETSVGSFVSFIMALLMLLAPLRHLTDVNASLQRGLAAAESVFELLDETPETDAGALELAQVEGALSIQGLSFRYPGSERDALSEITIELRPGQTVALVGQSGGGKSTLAALVPRFYNPTAGMICLDGHDIRTLSLKTLRRHIAYVSQDILLFNDTVAANIAYGDLAEASHEQVVAAARAANALDFIEALPQGFDTVIGEHGNRLSGGQRQRIAIARAVLKRAPILILDEATSALDNESERLVQSALDALMQQCTTLVIAHRLSTVEHADRIAVLAHGRIIETGTHAELLALDKSYAQLYRLHHSGIDSL